MWKYLTNEKEFMKKAFALSCVSNRCRNLENWNFNFSYLFFVYYFLFISFKNKPHVHNAYHQKNPFSFQYNVLTQNWFFISTKIRNNYINNRIKIVNMIFILLSNIYRLKWISMVYYYYLFMCLENILKTGNKRYI